MFFDTMHRTRSALSSRASRPPTQRRMTTRTWNTEAITPEEIDVPNTVTTAVQRARGYTTTSETVLIGK